MATIEIELLDSTDTVRTVQVDGLRGDFLETTPGETLNIPVYIDDQGGGLGSWGYDWGTNWGGIEETPYGLLEDLIDAAGPAAAGVDLDGTAWFVDRVRPTANVNSLLIKVSPVDIHGMDGQWAVVTGGEDETTILGSQGRLTLEVTTLAREGQYADRTAIINALESSLL